MHSLILLGSRHPIAERRTTPVELLWDLVFVFAVTQVTTLLTRDLSWAGFGCAACGLWWTYFDRFAATAQERLRGHHDPVLAAADAYSYLHLVRMA